MDINLNRNVALLEAKQTLSSIKSSSEKNDKNYNKKLKDASDGFEEIFVQKMLRVMRDSGFKSDLMKGGSGEEIFQDMLDEQYAKLLTKTKVMGLSNMIYNSAKKK